MMFLHRLIAVVCAGLVVSGCGGGGGSSNSGGGTTSATLSGTAAAGLPLIGSVTVKDANGQTKTVTIGGNGSYTVDVSGMTAPFTLRASGTAGGSTYVIHSAATSSDLNGTINITQLTDLILSNVAGQIASNYFDNGNFGGLTSSELAAEAAKLKEKLLPVLTALGVDASTDLLHTAFTPLSSALDKALDAIQVSYDTNSSVATLTNLLTSETLQDDVTVKAANESSPATMSETTNLSDASTDIPLIRAALSSFASEFSTGLPSVSALKSHMTSGFLSNDEDATSTASDMAQNSQLIGMQLADIAIHDIDYTTDSTKPVATVSFLVKSGSGVVLDINRHFKLKRINGIWKLHGDQRVLDASLNVHTVRTVYQGGGMASSDCRGTGLEFWIEDEDDTNSASIDHVVATGPGLPADGLRYNRPSSGGVWNMDSSAGQSGTWYQLANSCEGSPTAGATDPEIAAIADNSTYILTMYDSSGNVLTGIGNNGTYKFKIAGRPMTLAETVASTAFPVITSPQSFDAFVSYSGTTPTIAASNMNTGYVGWVYVAASYTGSGETSAEADVVSSNGTISKSFDLGSPTGSRTRSEIRVETHDSGLRNLMTNYLYVAIN